MAQRIITPGNQKFHTLGKDMLGEKAYKLFRMYEEGLPIPPFFTIVPSITEGIIITPELEQEFKKLKMPVIVRSSHPLEGAKHSFSGIFTSVGLIERLAGPFVSSPFRPFDKDYKPDRTKTWHSVQSAYEQMREMTSKIEEYIRENKIEEFSIEEINAIVMEERDEDIFAMFMTSDYQNPDRTIIHFMDQRERDPETNWRIKKPGIATYNLGRLEELINDSELEKALASFGELAQDVQNIFGVQQVELGYSDEKAEVFQARDINFNKDAPRYAHYKSIPHDTVAYGSGYFHLPVLVMDSLDHINSEYGQRERAAKQYLEEIVSFVENNKEFALVIKNPDVCSQFGNTYDILNKISRLAKVVFRVEYQGEIRHREWDKVEIGGINAWVRDTCPLTNKFIHNHIYDDEALESATSLIRGRSPEQLEGNFPRNTTLIEDNRPIKTGDYIHILSNVDGTFIWRD